jgi:ATP-dependent DNA helicase PIF1
MFLIILHPDNSNYEKIKVLDMKKEINLILEFRLNQIEINSRNSNTMEPKECKLSEKQKDALNKIVKGCNVFLTGPGGCGKSTIIKLFYGDYKDCKNIGITSTTGTSAILIGGVTLHSFLGIGLAKDSAESLYLKIKKKAYMFKRWRDLDTLIIDEISMLSPELFDKLELLARKLRNNELPFGGIQLVLTGDFLQLPCVETDDFCFEAKSWDKCIKHTIYLTEIFRQDNNNFQSCLNEIRIGKLSSKSIELLKSRVNIDLVNSNGIIPTKIYSLNVDVDNENQKELDKLFSKNTNLEFFEYELEANILKKNLKFVDEKIKKNCIAPQTLQLCIGAQVMLLYNINLEMGLANGSRGIITKFEDNLPVVKFINGVECSIDYQEWVIEENGEKIISITQIPLKVAYAITVHKCCEENTLIFTDTGIKRISKISHDICNNQYTNTFFNININVMGKEKYNTATQIYKGHIENTLEIVTKRGYRIEGSYRHPLLTYSNNKEEWKTLPNIKKGDFIILKNNINCYGNNIKTDKFILDYSSTCKKLYNIPPLIDYKLCYLIGLLIGDGTYSIKTDYPIEFCQYKKQKEIINYFKDYFEEIFETGINEYNYEYKTTTKLLKNSKHIRDFLYWCGLDYVTHENKTIPWVVFENDKESQLACLKGLFDTDGGVSNCIHYTTTSKQLAIDIQNLLLNNGIMSSLKKLTNNSKKTHKQAYRIQLTGHDGYLYYKSIGFNSKSKQKKLEKMYSKTKQTKIKSNIGLIPNGKEIIKKLRNEIYVIHGKRNKILFGNLSTFISRIIEGKANLRYYDLEYIYTNIKNIEDYGDSGQLISYLHKNSLFLDEVEEINKTKKQLYDLYVPETNTFIGNGIVNHNSQGLTIDFAELDLSDIFEYGQAYVALSRVKNLEGLSIKNLNIRKIIANKKAVEYYENL